MKRSIEKAIADYKKKYFNTLDNAGAFYVSDYYQIMELSQNKVDCIDNALMAGYMIGYRTAKREARNRSGGRGSKEQASR